MEGILKKGFKLEPKNIPNDFNKKMKFSKRTTLLPSLKTQIAFNESRHFTKLETKL